MRLPELGDALRDRTARRTRGSPAAPPRRRDVRAASSRSIWNVAGSHSTNVGVRAFHITACPDAENVKLGSTTAPGPALRERLEREHQPRCAGTHRDDVGDAEPLGDALLQFADERAVREHAAVVRGLEPAPHLLERGPGRPSERQRRTRTPAVRRGAPAPCRRCASARPPSSRRRPTGAIGRVGAWPTSVDRVRRRSRFELQLARDAASTQQLREQCRDRGSAGCVSRTSLSSSSKKKNNVAGSGVDLGWTLQIDGCRVGSTVSASSCNCSCSRSPGRAPVISIATSSSGRSPDEADHLAGEVDDRHGLAHVEQEHLALSRSSRRPGARG